jgi:hypothetical protein
VLTYVVFQLKEQFRLGYSGLFGLYVELEKPKGPNTDIKHVNQRNVNMVFSSSPITDIVFSLRMFDIGCQKHDVFISLFDICGSPIQHAIQVGLQWSVRFVS